MIIIARPVLVFLLLYIIIAELCLHQSTLALFFGHSIGLSPYASNSFSPQIAVSGSNVYVVWTNTNITSSSSPPDSSIYFKRSTDDGITFDDTVNLSSGITGASGSPQIAVSGSNVYVVWVDNSPENSAIYFKRSTDDGSTFDDTVNLSSGITGASGSPQIAVSGSNVYVVWNSNSSTSRIGNSDSRSQDNSTVADRGDIHFKRSTDDGSTFDDTVNLSSGNTGASGSPQIAVSGSNVYVVWTNTNSTSSSGASRGDIYFKKSADYGDTFDAKRNLSKNPGNSFSPQMAVSGSNVYVVWVDNSPGHYILYLKKSADYGDTFDAKRNLSKNPGNSFSPQIAVSGSNVYLVWSGDGGSTSSINKAEEDTSAGSDISNGNDCCGSGIYFRKSIDNGSAFASDINLDKNGRPNNPKIAVSGSNVYLVWMNNESHKEARVFFRSSADYGNIFSGIVVDLSHTASNAKNLHSPQIAVSGSNAYVVWSSSSTTTSNSNYAKDNISARSDTGSVVYFKRINELFFARNT
jgi:hypothetical protein